MLAIKLYIGIAGRLYIFIRYEYLQPIVQVSLHDTYDMMDASHPTPNVSLKKTIPYLDKNP